MHFLLLLLASAAGLSAAATIPVAVGQNGLRFTPDIIHAAVGDVIEFRFYPRNHSVVAGDFSHPCRPAAHGGFWSGFFPTPEATINDNVFRVTVAHPFPIPIYCSQNNGQHCANGMVAVINPVGPGVRALDVYKAAARHAGNATSPDGPPFGGVIAPREKPSVTVTRTTHGGGGGGGGSFTHSGSFSTGGSFSTTHTTVSFSTTVIKTSTITSTRTNTSTVPGISTHTATKTTVVVTPTATRTATGGGGAVVTAAAPRERVAAPVAGLVGVAVAALFV
ncbi:hypothetical protein VTJ83DRAFT_4492 [Remersonia thermophila]|uniref:Cupredoxin n=1 Tax=Remersonia thermophila TaxID=72144 RepID=A0ABR4DA59_9PEZI